MITIELINKARSKASEEYKKAVPIVYNESGVQEVAEVLLSCPHFMDEFSRILTIICISYFYNLRG